MNAIDEETGMSVLAQRGDVEYRCLPHQMYNNLLSQLDSLRSYQSSYASLGMTTTAKQFEDSIKTLESMMSTLFTHKKAVD